MMKKNLYITSLSSNAEGIGTDNGLKIFVDGALPEETIEMEVILQKKKYAKAHLVSIQKPSRIRTEPICPLFGSCGGCQIMHVQYPEQLALKRQRVIDALKRIGGLELEVSSCIPSPTSLGYRNKIQLPVIWKREGKVLGLYRKHTHEVIPIDRCLIQCPQGEEILQLINQRLTIPSVRYILIRNAIFNEEALVIFITDGTHHDDLREFSDGLLLSHSLIKGVVENVNPRQDNVVLGKEFRTLSGRPFIFEKILNKTFKISPSAFFQVNSEQTEVLYEKVLALAEIHAQDTVLDAFCGVGTLALFAADKAHSVVGIEIVSSAIEDAKENAALNKVSNCEFICGHAEDLIRNFSSDIVFLNPPRKGCEKKLIETLLKQKPKKIIYVSCDPATLARDLMLLSRFYEIDVVQPFDMFPQTMHVETVARLCLKAK